jgi:predicted phosphate transport protein (TIGR00153 family)
MKLNFLPKEERFFELFEDQGRNIVQGADLLVKLVANHTQAEELRQQIEEVEHEGDITTHEIADRLNRTFVTPFDHEDIHELAGRLDDILDNIEATADRMFLYEAGEASQEMVDLAEVLADAAKAVAKAVAGLSDIGKNAHPPTREHG